jgi:multisubunit Na+/H+ antiporter MnhG subunit
MFSLAFIGLDELPVVYSRVDDDQVAMVFGVSLTKFAHFIDFHERIYMLRVTNNGEGRRTQDSTQVYDLQGLIAV